MRLAVNLLWAVSKFANLSKIFMLILGLYKSVYREEKPNVLDWKDNMDFSICVRMTQIYTVNLYQNLCAGDKAVLL